MNHRDGFQTILDTHNCKAENSVYNLFSLVIIRYLEKHISILKHWSVHTIILVNSHFLTCLSENGNIVFSIERCFLYFLYEYFHSNTGILVKLAKSNIGKTISYNSAQDLSNTTLLNDTVPSRSESTRLASTSSPTKPDNQAAISLLRNYISFLKIGKTSYSSSTNLMRSSDIERLRPLSVLKRRPVEVASVLIGLSIRIQVSRVRCTFKQQYKTKG